MGVEAELHCGCFSFFFLWYVRDEKWALPHFDTLDSEDRKPAGVWMVPTVEADQKSILAQGHSVLYKLTLMLWNQFFDKQEAIVKTWELE